MTKIYLIISLCTIIIGAYFFGLNAGKSKCQMQNIQTQMNSIKQTQQNKKVINDTVYKTGVGDIRRILHDKYTIKE